MGLFSRVVVSVIIELSGLEYNHLFENRAGQKKESCLWTLITAALVFFLFNTVINTVSDQVDIFSVCK